MNRKISHFVRKIVKQFSDMGYSYIFIILNLAYITTINNSNNDFKDFTINIIANLISNNTDGLK